jgi:protein SCO1/2
LIYCLLATLTGAAPVRAEASLPASLQGVGFDQKVNEPVPPELEFRDEEGRLVRLGDYFHGKPVILVLAWYRCPMLCTEVLNGLVRAMLDMPFDAGKEYEVLTVSFDPRETAELAAAKKAMYVERYGRAGAEEGWHFLTGTQESIDSLTRAVGFRYRYDAKKDQFAHASGIVILGPTGKIFRYFLDIRYSPRDLRLSLVEASQNRIGTAADQVLLYCFHYDPLEGKYGAVILNILRLSGALTVLVVGTGVGLLWWRERRAARLKPTTEV